MFDFFKKKQVRKNMELYQKIQEDGVEYAGAQMAFLLIQKYLKNSSLAHQFILQELDGASYGNEQAVNFVQNSGISRSEYSGALRKDMPNEVEEATLFLVDISMELQPLQDFIVELRLVILNEIMKFYKLGKYAENSLHQDGLLDNLEPVSLLENVEIEQPWSFRFMSNDLDYLSDELPKNYNALMPILYAARFAYAGLYSQGRISWEKFDDIDKNHFMSVMIKVGNRTNRSEQIYFQEKSSENALEFLQEYEPLIDSSVVTAMIKSAKNKFSLQEAIGDDLIVTSYLSICYYKKFGYDGTEDEYDVRENFIDMLNRM